MKKIRWGWEQIDEMTSRVRVLGGWMVVYTMNKVITSIFVSDPSHEWLIVKPMPAPEPVIQEIPPLLKKKVREAVN
jgi:hypothetical protein